MATKLSAFGSATKKAPSGTSKPAPNIIAADDLKDPVTDDILFTKEEVKTAIEKLVEGKALKSRAESMISSYEGTVKTFCRFHYARLYVNQGSRPATSPKFVSSGDAEGAFVTAAMKNCEATLDQGTFANLKRCIGEKNALATTYQRDEFALNPAKLEMVMKVKGKGGKEEEKSVQDLIEEALVEKFKDTPEVLDGLFIKTPVWKTKKGTIDRLLDYVGKNEPGAVGKLAEALMAARVQCAITAGSPKAEKADD